MRQSVLFQCLLVLLGTSVAAFQARQARASFSSQSQLLSSTKSPPAPSSSPSQSAPSFINRAFFTLTECDNSNIPPSLNILLRSLQQLTASPTASDIRGRYVDHARLGSITSIAHAIGKIPYGSQPPLTPFATYCLGNALANQLLESYPETAACDNAENDNVLEIVLGRDPRLHGTRLTDALARGAESASPRIRVVYTGLATTPACAAFPRLHGCHAAVMVTASHLPPDRNGFKIFLKSGQAMNFQTLGARAAVCATEWFNTGVLPPSSGGDQVTCSQRVDYMPAYQESLKAAVRQQVLDDSTSSSTSDQSSSKPLEGLKIVLNVGNGAGGFFVNVLQDLGATVVGIHVEPDGNFPNQVPNPEYAPMLQETVTACQDAGADLGIMLDTDADRCGFVAPIKKHSGDGTTTTIAYEPLNRNRLIALLAVIFSQSHPGCAFVTDSVTSEGLATFLQENLGLVHVRYLKGYMNVINKAKELTFSGKLDVQVAIETSGHCAMQENNYLDDGTYTAVKVVSLLARQRRQQQQKQQQAGGSGSSSADDVSLLDLIADMEELDEISELRLRCLDDSLETMKEIFDFCAVAIEQQAISSSSSSSSSNADDTVWTIDTENLEGIRVRTGQGQFFMLRKSLHDPIISLQIEATSREVARNVMVQPLLKLFQDEERIRSSLDLSVFENY